MEPPSKPQIIHIVRWISRIREFSGMKQGELAADLGMGQQAISKIKTQ